MVSSNIKNGGGIVLNLLWLHGCVLTSPALEVKLSTKVAFCVPEGPSDCAKDLGEPGSSYTPLPLSGKAQNVLSFDGNESEGLNKWEVKCRALPVTVLSSKL